MTVTPERLRTIAHLFDCAAVDLREDFDRLPDGATRAVVAATLHRAETAARELRREACALDRWPEED